MSPLVLVPLAVLTFGALCVVAMARRLTVALHGLDQTLAGLERLEASRSELATELANTRTSLAHPSASSPPATS